MLSWETPPGRGLLCQSPDRRRHSGCHARARRVTPSIEKQASVFDPQRSSARRIDRSDRDPEENIDIQGPVGQRRDEAEHLVDFVFESSEETELTAGSGLPGLVIFVFT